MGNNKIREIKKWEITAFLRKDVTTLKSRYNKHTA